jgi:heat shock protein HtpX
MNKDELRAVLAHEIGHVANGDMVTLALVQGVVNAFVMFFARVAGDFIDRNVFGREDGEAPGLAYFAITIVLDIVFGVLASAIVMWFSRYREYRADEAGARLAGKQAMISALLRLQAESQLPDAMPKEMKAFAIAAGQEQGFSLAALFQTHPTIEQRVAALQQLDCP